MKEVTKSLIANRGVSDYVAKEDVIGGTQEAKREGLLIRARR